MSAFDSIVESVAALQQQAADERTVLRLGTVAGGGVVRDGETAPATELITLTQLHDDDRVLTASHNRRLFVLGKTVPDPAFPVGGILLWPSATAPDGGSWAICNGAAFDAGTYPRLAAVLGSAVLPDLRDRLPRGVSSGGAAVRTTGGSDVITAAQMPSHTHSVPGAGYFTPNTGGTVFNGVESGSAMATSGAAGTGAAYWPKFYAVNYVIRMA